MSVKQLRIHKQWFSFTPSRDHFSLALLWSLLCSQWPQEALCACRTKAQSQGRTVTDAEIAPLLSSGLLTRDVTGQTSYLFAVAGAGQFISSISKGRKVSNSSLQSPAMERGSPASCLADELECCLPNDASPLSRGKYANAFRLLATIHITIHACRWKIQRELRPQAVRFGALMPFRTSFCRRSSACWLASNTRKPLPRTCTDGS